MTPETARAPLPRRIADNLALLLTALWNGIMWGVGFLAVPVLFHTLPDKMLAGMLAGKMFTLVSWAGMITTGYLLLHALARHGKLALRQPLFPLAIAALALLLAEALILQPHMAALKAQVAPADITKSPLAGQFATLHYAATTQYLIECLLGIALLFRVRRY